jgi:hypothetical protein
MKRNQQQLQAELEKTASEVPSPEDVVKPAAKSPPRIRHKTPAVKPEPELAGAEKQDIRAQLEKLQQVELQEVTSHINDYLNAKGYELVPVIMFLGTQQNAQVQIRRKAQ